MKKVKLFLISIAIIAGASLSGFSQDGQQPENADTDERPGMQRPNLLAELGLSREQIQQIRRMNRERRPVMAEAQRRMREANRSLDMAIYGETITDTEFQTRLKEFQLAQADLARLRFEGELSVRKVLTPDQLVRFRELRRRFAELRNDNQKRRRQRRDRTGPPMQDGPVRRPLND